MTKKQAPMWVEGELRLAGALDNRIIGLLKAISESGSLNKAAKQLGLSYKGAWQILERANHSAPQILVATATGGNKGGGSYLTESGKALLQLFEDLEHKHQRFISQLNHNLADKPELVLLLQRLVIKTSARNQLFGHITDIQIGNVNANVNVQLKGGEIIGTTTDLNLLNELGLEIGTDAVLLINSSDITLIIDGSPEQVSTRNCLAVQVLSIQQTVVNVEVMLLLPSGETLTASITEQSLKNLQLSVGAAVWAIFKSNAPYLGVQA